MDTGITDSEPFLVRAGVRMLDRTRDRATVRQPPVPELDNHVGVRHASALHAAGFAAAQALVHSAVSSLDGDFELRLQGSEIAYKAMGLGELTTIAEPLQGGWEEELEQLRGGSAAEFRCVATTSNAEGRTVAQLSSAWIVSPPARQQ